MGNEITKKQFFIVVGLILATIVTSIIVIFRNSANLDSVNLNAKSAQDMVSLTYEAVTDDSVKEINNETGEQGNVCEFVEFNAFFVQDTDNDGVAERVNGACRSIKDTAELYFRFTVLSKGYLKDGKIKVNGENFKLDTSIPADAVVPKTYLESDTKQIDLAEQVPNGTQKLLVSRIKPRITNVNDYSREDNTVVFEGTYVYENDGGDEVEIPLRKVCNLTVDWYGELEAQMITEESLTLSNEDIYDEENNTVNLTFSVGVREYNNYKKNGLILNSNVVKVRVPELKGYSAITAKSTSEGVQYSYNETSGVLTITRKAEIDRDGNVLSGLSYDNTYSVVLTYPSEVYNNNDKESLVITVPVESYYTGYNNRREEFANEIARNIAKSNVVERQVALTFDNPEGDVYNFRTAIGHYMGYPSYAYIVSKKETLKAYNGQESEEKDLYEVMWAYTRGAEGEVQKAEMGYTKPEDLNESSFDEYATNVGIYFDGADYMLGSEGYIKVYDEDKTGDEALIHTFTAEDWGMYNRETPYMYEDGVKNVRVEVSASRNNSVLIVHNVKEIDNEKIASEWEREDFDSKNILYTYLTGKVYLEGSEDTLTRTGVADYVDEVSGIDIEVSKDKIPTTEITSDEVITINASSGFNMAKWKDGEFVVVLPEAIKDLKINRISSEYTGITIKGYKVEVVDGVYTIKILTENRDLLSKIRINIDCTITPNPAIPTTTGMVELYAYNKNYDNYAQPVEDIYDANNNGRNNDKVGFDSCSLQMISPTALITYQTLTDYDDSEENEIKLAPGIAGIEEDKRSAQVNLNILNNYTSTINEIKILGKIPFEGNTYVVTNGDLGSTFSTILSSEIQLTSAQNRQQEFNNSRLEQLQSCMKVYYSKNETPTNDLTLESNGWVAEEDVEDLSEMKTYLIDLGEFALEIGDNIEFKYIAQIPEGTELGKVAFSQHAVYFELQTPDGALSDYTEPNKLGMRIVKKFDLDIDKSILGRDTKVAGALYLLETGSKQAGTYESFIDVTDANGNIHVQGLHVGEEYTISEIKSSDDFDISWGTIKFKVVENSETNELEVEIAGRPNAGYKASSIENKTVSIEVEDKLRYDLNIAKQRTGTNIKVNDAIYSISCEATGESYRKKTDENGSIKLDNLYLDKVYIVEEVETPSNFVMAQGKLKFRVIQNAEDGRLETVIVSEGAGYKSVTEGTDSISMIFEDDVKYSLKLNKKSTAGENLAGVTYKITGDDIDESILTDANGNIESSELSVGKTYTVTETFAKGYYLNDPLTITVTKQEDGSLQTNVGEIVDDGKAVSVQINANDAEIPTYNLDLIKIEKGDASKKLENVSFRIKGKDLDKTLATDENGKISLTGLYQYAEEHPEVNGIYEIQEVVPAEGYVLVSDILKIRVYDNNGSLKVDVLDGENLVASDTNGPMIATSSDKITITLQNLPIFKVKKVDEDSQEEIPNTKFAIFKVEYDTDGSIKSEEPAKDGRGNIIGVKEEIDGTVYNIVKTNEDGEITADLPEGFYYLYEVEASDGYELPSKYERKHYFGIGKSKAGETGLALVNQKKFGQEGYFENICDIQEVDGGYIVIGSSYNSEMTVELADSTEVTITGAYILKYDESLENILWCSDLNTTGESEFNRMIVLDDGSIIVVGAAAGTNGSAGVLARYTKNGKKVYDKFTEIEGVERNIIKTENGFELYGNIVAYDLDEYDNEIIPHVTTQTQGDVIVKQGAYILKYDNNANLLEYINTTDTGYAVENTKLQRARIAQEQYGEILYNNGQTQITTQNQGTVNVYATAGVIKDADGNYILAYSIDNENINMTNAIRVDNSMIITGVSYVNATVENNGNSWEFLPGEFAIKVNSEGNIEALLSGYEPIASVNRRIVKNKNGEYVLGGVSIIDNTRTIQVLYFGQINPEFAEMQEITVENKKLEYKITTKVIQGEGTISGDGENPYETVIYKENSTKEIKVVPASSWEIKKITINGKIVDFVAGADGSYTLPQFTEMTEDKHIEVWFINPSEEENREYTFELKKTDNTNNPVANAKFSIKKVELSGTGEERVTDAVDNDGNLVGYEYEINGETLRIVESDENGLVKLDLPNGNYRITEVEAPEGYLFGSSNEYNVAVGIKQISYIEDLIDFANIVKFDNSAKAELTRNLDFNDASSYREPNNSEIYKDYNGDGNTEGIKQELSTGFKAIGRFKGILDGKGFEIKGIKGHLFDELVQAKVVNLGVAGTINITKDAGSIQEGGLSRVAVDSTIENCHSDCDITVYFEGTLEQEQTYVGGLIGTTRNTKIINCSNTGDIDVMTYGHERNYNGENKSMTRVGGIVGYASTGEIRNSYNQGNVTGKVKLVDNTVKNHIEVDVGGVVGALANATVVNCYNEGSVRTEAEDGANSKAFGYAGGIAGVGSYAKLINSYNIGNVTGNIKSDDGDNEYSGRIHLGGIAGDCNTIRNCYNVASVIGTNLSGETGEIVLAGAITSSSHNIIAYYPSTITVTGERISTSGTEMSASDMKAISFVNTLNANIEDITNNENVVNWVQVASNYPKLNIPDGYVTLSETDKESSVSMRNSLKKNKITSEILPNSEEERLGGTITGDTSSTNIKLVEEVGYGKDAQRDIIIVPDNKYKIEKILIDGEEIEFEPDNDGSYTIQNRFTNVTEDHHVQVIFEKEYTFKLTKSDDNNNPLPGAKFTIKRVVSKNYQTEEEDALDTKGNKVGTLETIDGEELYVLTSDENGEIKVMLPEGKYKVKEVKAPEGYLSPVNNEIEFELVYGITEKYETSFGLTTGYMYSGCVTADGGNISVSGDVVTKKDNTNTVEWQVSLKKAGYLSLSGIIEDDEGNYVAVGIMGGSVTIDAENILNGNEDIQLTSPASGTDSVIIKLDKTGKVIFAKDITYGGAAEQPHLIQTLDNGEYIVISQGNPNATYTCLAEDTEDGVERVISGVSNYLVHYSKDGKIKNAIAMGSSLNMYRIPQVVYDDNTYIFSSIQTNSSTLKVLKQDGTISTISAGANALRVFDKDRYVATGDINIHSTSGKYTVSASDSASGEEIVVDVPIGYPCGSIIEYNKDMKIVRIITIPSTGYSLLKGVDRTEDGGYVAVGVIGKNSEIIGTSIANNSDSTKGIILQIAPDGTITDAIMDGDVTEYNSVEIKNKYVIAKNGTSAHVYKKENLSIADIGIVNNKAGKVIVHHYLKLPDGTKTEYKVAEDELIEDVLEADYKAFPKKDIQGLDLEKVNNEYVLPNNMAGKIAEETQEVVFYYEPSEIKLTINHYYEGTERRVEGIEAEEKTYPSTVVDNGDGTYTITVEGSYDVDSNENYNTLINSYRFTRVTSTIQDNTSIEDTLIFNEDSEINFYYTEKGYKITTEVIPHTERRTNTFTSEKEEISVDGGTITGNYNEQYKEENRIKFVENVKENKNQSNATKITAKPDADYIVKRIQLISTTEDGQSVTKTLYGENVDEDAEITATEKSNGSVTLTTFENMTADKHIQVEFAPILSKVVVHHYYEGTGEEFGNSPVMIKSITGEDIPNEEMYDFIGEKYFTSPSDRCAEYYKYSSSSQRTVGKYTADVINVYYYYKYDNYNYRIEHYYENKETGEYEIDDSLTDVREAMYADVVSVTDADRKLKPEYGYKRQEGSPLTITTDPEDNVIRLYYGLQHIITTDVIEHVEENKETIDAEGNVTTNVVTGVKGGSISGEDEVEYERVLSRYDSTKAIEIIPDENYEIARVIVKDGKYEQGGVELDVDSLKDSNGNITLDASNGYFTEMRSDKHVEVEFKKKSKVIVKYLSATETDTEGNPLVLAEEEIIDGYESKEFTTLHKPILYYTDSNKGITDENDNSITKYSRVKIGGNGNAEGTMYADTLTVIYWYEKVPTGIIVKHIEINEADKEEGLTLEKGTLLDQNIMSNDVAVTEDTNRNIYTKDENGNETNVKYKDYISVDGPTSAEENLIIVTKEEDNKQAVYKENAVVEVRYYYEKQYKVTTEVKPHNEKNASGATILVEGGTISGKEDDVYEIINNRGYNSKEIIMTPDSGYRIKEVTIESISTRYEDGELKENITTKVYTKEELNESPQTHTITLSAGETNAYFKDVQSNKHIIVEYERIPAQVIVKYMDKDTKEEIPTAPEKVVNGYVNDDYNEPRIDIDNYIPAENTEETPEPTVEQYNNKMKEEPIEIIYWYTKQYKVTTEVIPHAETNKDGNEESVKGGTITADVTEQKDDEGNIITPPVAYEMINRGESNVKEVAEGSGVAVEIIPDGGYRVKEILVNNITVYKGDANSEFENDSKLIVDGKIIKIPTGYFTNVQENKHIQVVFEKMPTVVKVYYLEEETEKVLYTTEDGKEYVEIKGNVYDEYNTEEKDINGYKLVVAKYPTNAKGTMTEDVIIVKYYYKETTKEDTPKNETTDVTNDEKDDKEGKNEESGVPESNKNESKLLGVINRSPQTGDIIWICAIIIISATVALVVTVIVRKKK